MKKTIKIEIEMDDTWYYVEDDKEEYTKEDNIRFSNDFLKEIISNICNVPTYMSELCELEEFRDEGGEIPSFTISVIEDTEK